MADSLATAIEVIDDQFGDGFAKAHPELLAGLAQAGAISRVANAVGALSQQLEKLAGVFDGPLYELTRPDGKLDFLAGELRDAIKGMGEEIAGEISSE